MISIMWFRKSPDVDEGLDVLGSSPFMAITPVEAEEKAEAGLLTVEAGALRPNGYTLVDENGTVLKTRVL